MSSERRDVIAVLTHDHREVEELFTKLEAATPDDGETRRVLTDEVTIELVRHSVAEEMYLYPAARKFLPDGDKIADKEIAEHGQVEKTLKALEKTDADSEEFSNLLAELMSDVRLHIREEEQELFPELAAQADLEELFDLGDKVQAAKQKAPTRPHPSAPDRPPLNKLLGPGAGFVDRVRDHLSGRGSN
ncbi:MAG TPA: hemerythrin domain-containing protein [Streptosporangiaceae bacterium]|nr:hemerythrin domain-containing protein [Streptosporangiaceae bacterium]